MKLVAFRKLGEEGGPHFSEDQVKALAAEYQITDGPNDDGDMFERPGRPSDHFPAPFPNEQAAAAANGGAAPPDLSLIAKARGVERGFRCGRCRLLHPVPGGRAGLHPRAADRLRRSRRPASRCRRARTTIRISSPRPSLAMPPPLSDGQVTYADGIAADGRPVCPRRRRLPDVGGRAASGRAQAHRLPGDDLPGRLRRADVPDQEEGLGGRRALGQTSVPGIRARTGNLLGVALPAHSISSGVGELPGRWPARDAFSRGPVIGVIGMPRSRGRCGRWYVFQPEYIVATRSVPVPRQRRPSRELRPDLRPSGLGGRHRRRACGRLVSANR